MTFELIFFYSFTLLKNIRNFCSGFTNKREFSKTILYLILASCEIAAQRFISTETIKIINNKYFDMMNFEDMNWDTVEEYNTGS